MKKIFAFILLLSLAASAFTSCDLFELPTYDDVTSDYDDDDGGYFICTACDGDAICVYCHGDGTFPGDSRTCKYCHGDGICHHCDGKGYIEF